MALSVGDRVGALMSIEATGVARLFGYGIYEGDVLHPVLQFPNPRIKLDSGQHVWGCECWWGAEAAVKERIKALTVEAVDIDQVRQEAGLVEGQY